MEIYSINQFSNYRAINSNKKSSANNKFNSNKNIELATNPMYYPISFKAMKKSQFDGIDLATIEKFKLPVEKFNSNEDMQNYCLDLIQNNYLNKNYPARTQQGTIQRETYLDEWKTYLQEENKEYSPAMQLLIYDFITKGLNETNDKLPPKLNKAILASCIYDIQENFKTNKKYVFNLSKMYGEKIKEAFLNKDGNAQSAIITGWIEIPSKENDPENFKKNVEKLKTLSHDSWCTKTFNAEPYLAQGDFCIYLENGKPKLGVRYEKDKIVEIQGELNDSRIPLDYLEIAKEYTSDKKTSSEIDEKFGIAEKRKERIPEIKNQLSEQIKNKDYKAILEFFGSKLEEDEDGLLIIENYKDWLKCEDGVEIYLSDLVNKDDVTRKIAEFKEDLYLDSRACDFSNLRRVGGSLIVEYSNTKSLNGLEEVGGDIRIEYSELASMKNLKHIGGNAIFTESKIKNLDSLQTIKGSAEFDETTIKSMDNLKSIGRDASFKESAIESLKNLKTIGGSAYFLESNIKNLDSLELIGGDADFCYTPLTNLDKLESILGDAFFTGSELETLDGLTEISGELYLDNSNVKSMNSLRHISVEDCFNAGNLESLASLESIDGNANFSGSKITNLSSLKIVDGDVDFSNCEISSLENLEEIRGYANFSNSKFIYSKDSQVPRPLNNLKLIDGDANFSNSTIQTLKNLETINGNADFRNSKIRFLRGLKQVCGDIDFSGVRSMVYKPGKAHPLKNLTYVEGEIYCNNSTVSLGDFFDWGEPNCKKLKNDYEDIFLVLQIVE